VFAIFGVVGPSTGGDQSATACEYAVSAGAGAIVASGDWFIGGGVIGKPAFSNG